MASIKLIYGYDAPKKMTVEPLKPKRHTRFLNRVAMQEQELQSRITHESQANALNLNKSNNLTFDNN